LALYRRVAQIDPGNALAQDGIGQILAVLLEQARQALAKGDIDLARQRVERVAEFEASHPELPALRAQLADAGPSQQRALDDLLERADALLRRGRLTAPPGDNALALYRDALAAESGNRRAVEGLQKIATALGAEFDRAVSDFEIERADALLDQLQRADLLAPSRLAQSRDRLETARSRQQALQQNLARDRDPARLRGLLDEARAAVLRGDLWGPPGESAYDKLRQTLSADPDNSEAKQALLGLPAEARRHFEQALGQGQLGRARGYVEGLESQHSGAAGVADMKQRLSRAYAGYASERLGAGEFARAREGVDQARELDPDNPELVQLQARLEAAGGG
jgi:uncharacterized protein HemY